MFIRDGNVRSLYMHVYRTETICTKMINRVNSTVNIGTTCCVSSVNSSYVLPRDNYAVRRVAVQLCMKVQEMLFNYL